MHQYLLKDITLYLADLFRQAIEDSDLVEGFPD